jgi:hypothetical protein
LAVPTTTHPSPGRSKQIRSASLVIEAAGSASSLSNWVRMYRRR